MSGRKLCTNSNQQLPRRKTRRQFERNPEKAVIRVSQSDSGASLQALLARALSISRNKAKLLLDQRNVFVNGARVWMANHAMHAGDIVEAPRLFGNPALAPKYQMLDEDSLFLVVDKPSGIESTGAGSLEEILRRERNEPGLSAVHRLDRDTTGCWLLAREAKTEARLVDCFAQRLIRKLYHVVVRGMFPHARHTITSRLDGLEAVTHIKRLRALPNASHLLVEIHTGRTHQIRRHLAGIGFPVLGDARYGGGQKLGTLERSLPRQMLHASELIFPHPVTGSQRHATSPLPWDFRECLRLAGLKTS